MSSEAPKMKSIWFLVGLVLLVMGGLVLLGGILDLFVPSGRTTVLANTHPAIWWGGVMLLAGSIFYFTHRK